MTRKNILYVVSELYPYTPKNFISNIFLEVSKMCYKFGNDIRIFMPKFGIINERRHQLHEVIRLSGINIKINYFNNPLLVKVSSIPNSRLQVYFIDNEKYFGRKSMYDDQGLFYKDNDERSLFFVKGVLESVKCLNWKPDIIHIYGWLGYLLPLYIKVYYKNSDVFKNTNIFVSLHDFKFTECLNKDLINKINLDKIPYKYLDILKIPSYDNLNRICFKFSDCILIPKDGFYDSYLINDYKFKVCFYSSVEDLCNLYNTYKH